MVGRDDALDARVCHMKIPGHMHSEYQNSILLHPERASCTLVSLRKTLHGSLIFDYRDILNRRQTCEY